MSDFISRQDAIDAMIMLGIKRAVPILITLPSIEPKRKNGRWIPVESQTVNGRCSVCGYESHLYENDVYGENYCPNCGSWLRLL